MSRFFMVHCVQPDTVTLNHEARDHVRNGANYHHITTQRCCAHCFKSDLRLSQTKCW